MKWIFGLTFGGIGLVIFLVGVGWGVKRISLVSHGTRTQGSIVEMIPKTSEKGKFTYYPIVEFETKNNQKYRFEGSTGSSSPEYVVGETVDIIYRDDRPEDAQIANFTQFWLGPLGVGIFGFIFLVAGIGSFIAIGKTDEAFGPAFHEPFLRERLMTEGEGVKVTTRIGTIEAKKSFGKPLRYILVCESTDPNHAGQSYRSMPLVINPGPQIIGRPVDVYADPYDDKEYYVHLEPLLHDKK